MSLSGGNGVPTVTTVVNNTVAPSGAPRIAAPHHDSQDFFQLGNRKFSDVVQGYGRTGDGTISCPPDVTCETIARRFDQLIETKATLRLYYIDRRFREQGQTQASKIFEEFEKNCTNSELANKYEQVETDYLRSATLIGLVIATETLVRGPHLTDICPDGKKVKENYGESTYIDITLELMRVLNQDDYEKLKQLIQRHGLLNVGISVWGQEHYSRILASIQEYLCEQTTNTA